MDRSERHQSAAFLEFSSATRKTKDSRCDLENSSGTRSSPAARLLPANVRTAFGRKARTRSGLRSAEWMMIQGGKIEHLFPLTPTLSLGERENFWQSVEESNDSDCRESAR